MTAPLAPTSRVALASLSLLLACSDDTTTAPSAPCVSVYADRCNTPCTSDAQCAAGLYCLTNRCTADCAPGARACDQGRTCAPNGRCITSLVSVDGGPLPLPDGGGGRDACASINVQLARQRTSVMLLIDQSGSMREAFGNTTRWDAVRRALVDPMTGVLRPLQAELRFGLALYTSLNGSSGGMCPMLTPPIPVALNNFDAIARALNMAMPQDDTPTAESVTAATRLLNTVGPDDALGSRVLVLATDGEPDTCADPDAQNTPARQAVARADSVAAVRAAFATGVRTYVISVGADVSEAHLRDLANAGAGTTNARFYRALDAASLAMAFREITSGARSCVFRLNGRVEAAAANQGDVRLDFMPLSFGAADGWRLRTPNEIELTGMACQRARTTGSVLTATFPCGVVTPG